jgi:excisionase family DNA binding protein
LNWIAPGTEALPHLSATSASVESWRFATRSGTKVTCAARIMRRVRKVDVIADLSPREAARQTGLSRTLIYREIERGHLRAYKVGGRLRITREALAEWKRLHAVSPHRKVPAYEPVLGRRAVPSGDSFAAELRAIRAERAA